jgi:hypothetical protein
MAAGLDPLGEDEGFEGLTSLRPFSTDTILLTSGFACLTTGVTRGALTLRLIPGVVTCARL